MNFPLSYDEPLFRPPSEAYSMIFQITKGCSWNKCAFCEMYTNKSFKVKSLNEIKEEIHKVSLLNFPVKKIFLADGDAMVLSTEKIQSILTEVNNKFNAIRRISAYAKPKDLFNKSVKELKLLKSSGLELLYVGIESGDDEVLRKVNKGETSESIVKGLLKAKEAGIKLSVMILNGLGGKELSSQHAQNSGRILNMIQPEYVSSLVLSFPYGVDHYLKRVTGKFTVLNKFELIEEMRIFLEATELEQSVFRSDHASNYLVLKGILSRDKKTLLDKIEKVLQNPKNAFLREENMRAL